MSKKRQKSQIEKAVDEFAAEILGVPVEDVSKELQRRLGETTEEFIQREADEFFGKDSRYVLYTTPVVKRKKKK